MSVSSVQQALSPEPLQAAALIDAAGRRLAAAGVDDARRNARLLLAHALGLRVEELLCRPETPVDPPAAARYDALIDRRAAHEPVSRIVGTREFWSLPFAISPAVLDPRPDSETLIDGLLQRLPDRNADLRILDLGTGSGCLLLSLLSELPSAYGVGTDLSLEALHVACHNAMRLGLGERACFVQGDWAGAAAPGWSVIVCNPPYVARSELAALAAGVTDYDPRLALDGGADGLAAYRTLLPQVGALLVPGAWLALEIGHDQGPAVGALLAEQGFGSVAALRDLAGRERCLLAQAD